MINILFHIIIISIFSYSKPRNKKCDFVTHYVFKYLNFINGGSCQNPLIFENDTIYQHVLHLSQRCKVHLILPRKKNPITILKFQRPLISMHDNKHETNQI